MLRQGHGLVNRRRERTGTVHRFLNLGLTVCRLERVGDEVRLVRVVERGNRELELVCDLQCSIQSQGRRTKRGCRIRTLTKSSRSTVS